MLTVNELFAGIGSQRAALERLGIEHKVVGIAEIDKFAIKSYEAIWGETKNYGDISKVDKLDYADFWTYSFPCQDISVAGKQAGIKHGKTRSGLLYEVERLLEVAQEHDELPKYLMLENVKNLVGKKFKPQFEEWTVRLDELGFDTYYQVLNAKNYGIPQNRERVFGISIRKDIDTGYVFPEPFELKTRLKDILEDEVDEKFYLDNEKTRNLIRQLDYKPTNEIKLNQLGNFEKLANPSKKFNDPQTGRVLDAEGICQALDTMQGGNRQPKILQVGNVNPSGNGMNGNVFSQEGLSPTVTTNKGEGLEILEPTGIDKSVNNPRVIESANCITSREDRGISNRKSEGTAVIEPILFGGMQKNQAVKTDGISTCLTSSMGTGGGYVPMITDPIVCEQRTDEGLRFFKGDYVGTLRTIDSCGDKRVLIPQATKKGYIECNVPGVADLSFPDSKTRRGRVQENGEICPTLMAGQQDICYMEPVIAASRGRNPNNPSDRTPGSPTEQRLEVNQKGTSNTITTVQKDNYVIEPSNLKHTELPCIYDDRDKGFGTKTSDVCPTQRANRHGIKCIETDYRIRKLTPKECWRLMGFTDEQFYKAEKVNSNSQLYKQAGNSIVVDVLYYLFKNLFIDSPTEKTEPESELPGQMSIMDYL